MINNIDDMNSFYYFYCLAMAIATSLYSVLISNFLQRQRVSFTTFVFVMLIAVAMKSEPIESDETPAAVWWNSDIEAMRDACCKQEN